MRNVFFLLIVINFSCNNDQEEMKLKPVTPSVSLIDSTLDTVQAVVQKSKNVSSLEDALIDFEETVIITEEHSYSNHSYLIPKLAIPSELPFLEKSLAIFSKNENYGSFYQFDVSNDLIEDIILISNFGAEESHCVIWINDGDSYYFAEFFWGNLLKLTRKSSIDAYSVVIMSGFCCASSVGEITLFSPSLNKGKLSYQIESNYKMHRELESPKTIISSRRFITTNDNYRLRSSPKILNSTDSVEISLDIRGNILAEFKKGSAGTVISEVQSVERDWWFVIMDTNSVSTYNNFHDDKNSHKVGWMSSKYLKVTN